MAHHVRLHLGGYFSEDIEICPGWRFASSAVVPDIYWNYAYSTSGASMTPEVEESIRTHASRISRSPAWWHPSEPGDHADSLEAWMMLRDLDALREAQTTTSPWRLATSSVANDDVLSVFGDAYGPEGSPDDAGYFELPPAYIDALRDTVPEGGVRVAHTVAYHDGEPVGIASVYQEAEGFAGLYNVGVSHGFRRRGVGSAVSASAVARALDTGATEVILQTPASSPVESLYRALGFERVFCGVLAAL